MKLHKAERDRTLVHLALGFGVITAGVAFISGVWNG
jgi:hypothetical protein